MVVTHQENTASPRKRHRMIAVFFFISLIGAGFSWIAASPIGGSPDDDFHMGSIWCPRPAEESCETAVIDGVLQVKVPEPVALATDCHAHKPDQAAVCPEPLSDAKEAFSTRFDEGSYPTLYYRFHHLLIQETVDASILVMRAANFLIAVMLFAAIGILLEKNLRYPYLLAMAASWAPMGIYFLTSINPSSWAIVGTFAYATAMWGAFSARDEKRRWALTALALLGALMSFGSRGDAAFYVFVVTAALFFAFAKKRQHLPQWILAGALSVVGIYLMLNGGQAGNIVEARSVSNNPIAIALRTLVDLPRFFGGLVGYEFGPGWFDIPLNGTVVVLAVMVTGSLLLAGIREGSWRKWMSALMVFGAMAGIPVLIIAAGTYPHLGPYQPRYILPLLAVLMFILFASDGGMRLRLSWPQKILLLMSLWVVLSFTLHTILWRYVKGLGGVPPINLDALVSWWWNIPISPMTTWVIGTVSMGVALVTGSYLARSGHSPQDRSEVSHDADERSEAERQERALNER